MAKTNKRFRQKSSKKTIKQRTKRNKTKIIKRKGGMMRRNFERYNIIRDNEDDSLPLPNDQLSVMINQHIRLRLRFIERGTDMLVRMSKINLLQYLDMVQNQPIIRQYMTEDSKQLVEASLQRLENIINRTRVTT